MTAAKSPRAVLTAAYVLDSLILPLEAHRRSPKTETRPQLFACLVFMEFLQFDDRKPAATLADTPELCRAFELERLPRFHQSRYGQRWQDETVNSMLKRFLGAALRARTTWSRCRELFLRAITLNVMRFLHTAADSAEFERFSTEYA